MVAPSLWQKAQAWLALQTQSLSVVSACLILHGAAGRAPRRANLCPGWAGTGGTTFGLRIFSGDHALQRLPLWARPPERHLGQQPKNGLLLRSAVCVAACSAMTWLPI